MRPHWTLRQSSCASRLVHTPWFICIYLSLFLFYLQTPRWHTNQGTKIPGLTLNNRSKNLNGSDMCHLWVIQCLCSEACEGEFDYPWQNMWQQRYRKSTIRDKPSTYDLGYNKKKLRRQQTTQTPTQPPSYPTYIKLGRRKLWANQSKNLNDCNEATDL
jgi:hypothetical protein